MDDGQYGMADLRPYAAGRTFLPSISQPTDIQTAHPYYVLNFGAAGYAGRAEHPPAGDGVGGLIGAAGFGAEDGGVGRWPRQETLTLLEIRSRLDARFKEANHKGPLWEEVSRIMYDEYGYQRSGKKCREKFENLYKYYKKTKGGKAGRADGKHYRFFNQLEALCGGHHHTATTTHHHPLPASFSDPTRFMHAGPIYELPKTANHFPAHQESYPTLTTITHSSDFDTIVTSENDSTDLEILEMGIDEPRAMRKFKRRNWMAEIEGSVDIRMKKIMQKQEAWMDQMTRAINENENVRNLREEQWRRQDAERVERERRMWAEEKTRILARDAALMEAFEKLAGYNPRGSPLDDDFVIRGPNEMVINADWEGNTVAWDCGPDGNCFVKLKRMGCDPYRVGPTDKGQGHDRDMSPSRDIASSYFSGDSVCRRNMR